MGAPLSREAVVAAGTQLAVLGGITPAGTSLAQVSSIDPRTGTVTSVGSLATAVHDAAAATIGRTTFVLGGGSPDTVPTVQSFPAGGLLGAGGVTGAQAGRLPQPRSDLAVATLPDPGGGHGSTTYVVGGYDGTQYLPSVLATGDGTHFTTVARLPVAVRYPAVVADAGRIYAFGGQVPSSGATTVATDDIQMIDPGSHQAAVVGHLPRALYGASAFLIGGNIYVAGGQVPGERPSLRSTPSCRPADRCSMPAFSPRRTPSPVLPRSEPGMARSVTWSEAKWPPSPEPTRPAWPPARSRR